MIRSINWELLHLVDQIIMANYGNWQYGYTLGPATAENHGDYTVFFQQQQVIKSLEESLSGH